MINNFLPSKFSRIAVGLSGGVDSGLTAFLLKQKGYQLIGFHLILTNNLLKDQAEKMAKSLNIPFFEKDFRFQFKRQVLNKIIKEYRLGKTPNPCILCNKFVRFNSGLKWVKKNLKAEFIATGHYVRKTQDNRLIRAKDLSKDQSYFLYKLDNFQLKRLCFPLGNWYKKDVWQEAKKINLPTANSKESFDICFTKNLGKFLKPHVPSLVKSGKVVTVTGEIIGKHKGLVFYTVGSRGDWTWLPEKQQKHSQDNQINKMYVVDKNMTKNQLIVGNRQEASQREFKIKNLKLRNKPRHKLFVKIRSTGKLLSCRLKRNQVILDQSVFAITPGQSAVFYQAFKDGFELIGGGEIR